MTRAFVALPLPDEVTAALSEVQAELQFGRAVPEENMHVTLAFLDDQPEYALEAMHEALSGIRATAPVICIQGLEVFGGKRPRLLVAAVEKTPDLIALRDDVRRAARVSGIELPRQRFRPHITLVRFAHNTPETQAARLPGFLSQRSVPEFDQIRPDGFGLFASQLRPEGPVYENLAVYPLHIEER